MLNFMAIQSKKGQNDSWMYILPRCFCSSISRPIMSICGSKWLYVSPCRHYHFNWDGPGEEGTWLPLAVLVTIHKMLGALVFHLILCG